MFAADLLRLAETLLEQARAQGVHIVTAESCTGGLIAGCLTEIPGSSDVLERGFVPYSDRAKTELLGVAPSLIAAHGAVSEQVARAMATGALAHAAAELSISVTGIAGPGGGTAEKPVGLVHFATARRGGAVLHVEHRFGAVGRNKVRMQAVETALVLLRRAL